MKRMINMQAKSLEMVIKNILKPHNKNVNMEVQQKFILFYKKYHQIN